MPERIVYHRAGSVAKAEAIIEHGFDRTSGDQYGVGLWTCIDPEMWRGGPVQFKLRVTYDREAYWDEVPEAGRAWTGNPKDVDNVYDAKGIDVVRRGEIDFLIRERPKIKIIGYRMLEPDEGPWRPYNEDDSASIQAVLAEVRSW
jgi:hypothetical protein